eukprot:TRINITY_DN11540_c0_g2_i1.p1 TRINITY_DN11540_c0_g2~~TRINITY_DN11540_c0_g2_i1.p1  ORF type:complete len:988 (+),score=238.05 TRINITY_DN11540_c0_g2_i1:79-3042(+)
MPGDLKVRVVQARDLPVMNNAQQADAYVEVKLNQHFGKTKIVKKSLNPRFDEDFRFEVEDEDLQNEVLQFKVYDHDYITNDNAVGQVVVDLKPLLKEDVNQLSGNWPIYDTLHGIRGSLELAIKLKLIQDHHRFRDSSVDVVFFTTMAIPRCYKLLAVLGLAEELIVNDDPEYQWIDRLRPTRASNQARQKVFTSLTGQLQRQLGVKAQERGGNAVVGYRQCYDLEGETGLVARGIGTIVKLQEVDHIRLTSEQNLLKESPPLVPRSISHDVRRSPLSRGEADDVEGEQTPPPLTGISPAKGGLALPTTSGMDGTSAEIPLLTMCSFPAGFLIRLGGIVVARSIKLLNRIDNPDETDARDAWWDELRSEVRASARQLGYSAVVGYVETTSICNNICLLSATGTAAQVNTDLTAGPAMVPKLNKLELASHSNSRRRRRRSTSDIPMSAPVEFTPTHHAIEEDPVVNPPCRIYHLPQSGLETSFNGTPSTCQVCQRPDATVPEILFTTVDPPGDVPLVACSTMLQARVCRARKKVSGSSDQAIALGEAVPFLEYDLHEQLYHKMKLRGVNALFNVRIQVTIGETLLVAVATATALNLACLPNPPQLQFQGESDLRGLRTLQPKLLAKSKADRAVIEQQRKLSKYAEHKSTAPGSPAPDTGLELDNSRKIVIVAIDDEIDLERVKALEEVELQPDIFLCSTQRIAGLEEMLKLTPTNLLDTFTTVIRSRVDVHRPNGAIASAFHAILEMVDFKYRNHRPIMVTNLRWDIALPEGNDIQIVVTASVVGLEKTGYVRRKTASNSSERSYSKPNASTSSSPLATARPSMATTLASSRPTGLFETAQLPVAHDVVVTPLNQVPGQRTKKHLGAVILYLIKETMSLRQAGGIGRFTQHFIREVLAVARAEVAARGGNALVGYRVRDLDILDNETGKGQGQCLIAVQGDALLTEDHPADDDDLDDDDANVLIPIPLPPIPASVPSAEPLARFESVV